MHVPTLIIAIHELGALLLLAHFTIAISLRFSSQVVLPGGLRNKFLILRLIIT